MYKIKIQGDQYPDGICGRQADGMTEENVQQRQANEMRIIRDGIDDRN